MRTGPRVATAVAVGYILGRTHRMKLAIAVGGVLAGRSLSTDPVSLLRKAGNLAASSPEWNKLTGEIREGLLDAARMAAAAAVANKIDSLGDNIRERAQVPAPRSAEERQAPEEEQEEGRREAPEKKPRRERHERAPARSGSSTASRNTSSGSASRPSRPRHGSESGSRRGGGHG